MFATRTYERAIRKFLSDADRRAMEAAIAADPRAAPVMPGTGGFVSCVGAVRGRASGAVFGRYTSVARSPTRSIS